MVVIHPTSPNLPSSLKFISAQIICKSLSFLINQPVDIQMVALLANATSKVNHEASEFISDHHYCT